MNDTAVMEDPTLGDGEEPPEIEAEFVPDDDAPEYPWAETKDQMLRSFVFQTVVEYSLGTDKMEEYFQWIKSGKCRAEKKQKHPKLVEG